MIKVLVNALIMNDRFSGVEYAADHLLQSISGNIGDRYSVEVLLSKKYSGSLQMERQFSLKPVHFNTENKLRRIIYEHLGIESHYKKEKFDLYHAMTYVLPFFTRMPSILTVHDIISLDFPQYCKDVTAVYYRLFLPRSVSLAKRIIAVSETVRGDIIRRLRTDPDKIDVVHHGVDSSRFKKISDEALLCKVRNKYKLPEKFILFVGNLEPKKNIPALIRAFIDLYIHAGVRHKLIIVGKEGWKFSEIHRLVRAGKMGSMILFTGYVGGDDLPAIYSLADLLVVPSLYEGFGLPVLEAMACRTPVVVSDRGALPEIAGAVYPRLDPYDTDDIARKILTHLTDTSLREKNVEYGVGRAAQFSWDRTAAKTLATYERTIDSLHIG